MVAENDPRDVLPPRQTREVIELVNYVSLGGTLSVFGIATNVINMAVFYKQGLQSTTNIGFFGLAVSDLCVLLTLLDFALLLNPLVEYSDIQVNTREVQYLLAGWPHVCFTRTTCLIMAYVTAERCICITFPLTVKQMITPRRTTFIMCFIFIISILMVLPEFVTTYFDWKVHHMTNTSSIRLIGIYFTSNRKDIDSFSFLMNGLMGIFSLLLVIVFTSVLVWKLKNSSEWRKHHKLELAETKSTRDKKAMKMVLLISSILIVCSVPNILVSTTSICVEGISIIGYYQNLFYVLWSFAFVFGAINSSINIFLYYKMSSKYRLTFHAIFCQSVTIKINRK
ncbi:histamine H2 receptor-like [Physella acuta]|uniref:histamine H2 receptor-like n=1 Tax=Physella acuta TaxID=109671 RepID=UPI0027DD197B|nr:histamine H2 receptor-like [Physella acuta]